MFLSYIFYLAGCDKNTEREVYPPDKFLSARFSVVNYREAYPLKLSLRGKALIDGAESRCLDLPHL